MKTTHLVCAAALASLALAGCSSMYGSSSAAAPAKVADGMLVGPNGMTLYVFDKDSGDYSVITRDDGKKQWALKGKPLYYWAKDAKPGDKTGDGVLNIWHVAKP